MKGSRNTVPWAAKQPSRKKVQPLKPGPPVLDWSYVHFIEFPMTENEVLVKMLYDAKVKCFELGIEDARVTEVLTLHFTPKGITTLEEAVEGNHLKVRVQGWKGREVVSLDVDVRMNDTDGWVERV